MNNYAITYELQQYDLTFVRYIQAPDKEDAIIQFNIIVNNEHPNKLIKISRVHKVTEHNDQIVATT